MLKKRALLKLLGGVTLAPVFCTPIVQAFAKNGGGHEGHDGHDDDNEGNDDDKGKNPDGLDQDEALRELKRGRIIPLKTALKIIDDRVSGKVIDIKLTRTLGRSQYRIKIRRDDGVITTIRLDAKTGNFVGVLGF